MHATIETIDIGANTASASAASSWVGSAAISRSTTAPVPARPWSSPMDSACPGLRTLTCAVTAAAAEMAAQAVDRARASGRRRGSRPAPT